MYDKFFSVLIRDHNNVSNEQVRVRYGVFTGIFGLTVSLLLFFVKLAIGILSGSIGIIADAFNMLGDFGSSLVVLLGFKLSAKPPDKEHPYGHGRLEYIAAFIISLIIILLGMELLKSSITKIINPQPVSLSLELFIIYFTTIFVVAFRGATYRYIAKKINSMSIMAAAKDSRNDIIGSIIFLLGMVVSAITGINIDGFLGSMVAVFIIYSGINIAKETISNLLGQAPDNIVVENIKDMVIKYPGIVGMHDLVVHNYGPSKCFAYLHAEVSSDLDIKEGHEIIDNCERSISKHLGIELVIHMDPIAVDDDFAKQKEEIEAVIKNYNKNFSIHDLRVAEKEDKINLIFDLVKPYECKIDNSVINNDIAELVKSINEKYNCIMHIESGSK